MYLSVGRLAGILLFALLFVPSCAPDSPLNDSPNAAPFVQVCVVSDKRICEASGLAYSKQNPNSLWIHNDSGDTARLFLVGLDGETQNVFKLNDTPMPLDWEDMSGFTVGDKSWLIVGDVGDNSFSRLRVSPDSGTQRACRLLIFPEPDRVPGEEIVTIDVHTTILFEYSDGPHNCESIAVDSERNEILLVSKSKSNPLDCGIYRIPLNLKKGAFNATAQRIGSLDITNATAMDISQDGRRMIIISYQGAAILERSASEDWEHAVIRKPFLFALPERKGGETVCFGRSREELYLNSEQAEQPIWHVQIPRAKSSPQH